MNVQRFNFQEFGDILPAGRKAKPFLPTGRLREEVPPPPPAPSFTEEQLKAAERDSYKKGFLEGTEEGRKQAENEQAQTERALVAMVESFTGSITPLLGDYRTLAVTLREHLPKVAQAIAKKVAGAALDQNSYAAIEEIAVRCCESMATEPKITITLHEKFGDTLEKRLKEVAARMPSATDIIIMRDPSMSPTDCRIEWDKGSLQRSTEKLWECIEKAIGDMTITARREAEQHIEALVPAGRDNGSAGPEATTRKPDPAQPLRGSQDSTKKE